MSSLDIHHYLTISLRDGDEPTFSATTQDTNVAVQDVRRAYERALARVRFIERWLESMEGNLGVRGSSGSEREQALNDQEVGRVASDSQPPPEKGG